jgi:hypothetical protein
METGAHGSLVFNHFPTFRLKSRERGGGVNDPAKRGLRAFCGVNREERVEFRSNHRKGQKVGQNVHERLTLYVRYVNVY